MEINNDVSSKVKSEPFQLDESVGDYEMHFGMTKQDSGDFVDDQLKCQDQEVEIRKAMETEENENDRWFTLDDIKKMKVPYFLELYHELHDVNKEGMVGEGCSSVASFNPQLDEDVESSIKPNEKLSLDMMCINCNNMFANVVSLPCKHLCLCYYCSEDSMACPICNTLKKDKVILNLPSYSRWL